MLSAVTQAAGIFESRTGFGEHGLGVAWGDLDGDGDFDLVIGSDTTGVREYHNDGTGILTPVELSPDSLLPAEGIALGDYDNDGRLDMALARYRGGVVLLRNAGAGHFEQLLLGPRYLKAQGVAWGDYNRDSYIDLGVVSEYQENLLFRNDAGTFTQLYKFGFGVASTGVSWTDFDNDGSLDFVVGEARVQTYARFFRNCGADSFALVTLLWFGEAIGIVPGDLDNDGRQDFVVTTWKPESSNLVLWNNGDAAFRVESQFGSGDSRNSAIGDFDLDGNLDVLVPRPDSLRLYRGDGHGGFVSEPVGSFGRSYGLASADVDDDGDLDVIVTSISGANTLLINKTNSGNFVKLKPFGRSGPGSSNRAALGTRAQLRLADGTLAATRVVDGGHGGFPSQDAQEIHFGAIAGDTFTVLVTWPASGIVDTLPNVIPPARLKVVENRRPGPFSLASPAKGAEVSRNPTLAWHRSVDPDGDVVTYDLWYGKDPSFSTHSEVKGLADTTWTPPALLDSATYYWKVLAVDREHRVISYRNHYTDTMAVDSLGAQTWCNEQDWYFNATAAGMAEGGRRQPGLQVSLSVGQNPARGAVRVSYAASAGGFLDVFSADGRAVLAQSVRGTGTLVLGRSLPQGVYFVRLTADRQERTAKVVKMD